MTYLEKLTLVEKVMTMPPKIAARVYDALDILIKAKSGNDEDKIVTYNTRQYSVIANYFITCAALYRLDTPSMMDYKGLFSAYTAAESRERGANKYKLVSLLHSYIEGKLGKYGIQVVDCPTFADLGEALKTFTKDIPDEIEEEDESQFEVADSFDDEDEATTDDEEVIEEEPTEPEPTEEIDEKPEEDEAESIDEDVEESAETEDKTGVITDILNFIEQSVQGQITLDSDLRIPQGMKNLTHKITNVLPFECDEVTPVIENEFIVSFGDAIVSHLIKMDDINIAFTIDDIAEKIGGGENRFGLKLSEKLVSTLAYHTELDKALRNLVKINYDSKSDSIKGLKLLIAAIFSPLKYIDDKINTISTGGNE